ncbi:M23 family metallopeptidase [Brevibacillus formosus]|uniref:Metalloendopeptidase n=1 Tax=Brevibacillus formosus TaxID=54913 RepID=A0A837KP43_9BACL|nr:M23 family metallopeptidase [Brevibacillus formosus]KLH99417.1 metalloendopeptidase [Brevibacillus formosus]MED1956837.1 M23 family metallopeptidase [Brevibacillus formosus]PSJ92934.1 M23 family peptidase [Brevibacillus formosus]GED57235.1 metalloendopeptidase [Brevibacillus formosus]
MHWSEWKAKLQERSSRIVRDCSDLAKRTMKRTSSYIQSHKKQSLSIAAGLVLTIAAGASAQYYYTSNVNSVYHVSVNGKEIGVVNDPNVIHNWTATKLEEEKAKTGLNLQLADYITFEEEREFKASFNNDAAVQALASVADIKVQGVKLMIDGKVVGYLPDQQSADQVLAEVKQKYSGVPATTGKKAVVAAASTVPVKPNPVKEVAFKENVEMQNETVDASQILSADKLEELLVKGTFKDMKHTVVEGDCIGCIAKKYGITSKDIYANNPGVTENTVLQLGQEINVTAVRPLVTVQVKEEVDQQEVIAFNTQINNNDKVPKGETKVVQEGKNGSKTVKYEVVKENGQVVSRKVIKQDVTVQPVTKIMERGTKVIPSRGTGRLSWPASGYISSGFGKRWGSMHKGIDIAGAGSVMAADNGRVTFAGWNGDYGKSVIIDHGNGMKTLYGHMSSINVKVGDVVSQGKKIGVKGSTGQSTGVHLHFEVLQNGRNQNPIRYLK